MPPRYAPSTRRSALCSESSPLVVVLAVSTLGVAGLAVLGTALVALLVSLLHPEGRRRPGGYLDGQEPGPRDDDQPDA
jgi:hypothetical protein